MTSLLLRFQNVASLLISIAGLSMFAAELAAADNQYLLNFDMEITTSGNDDVSASIQQQGIRFSPVGQVRGDDLGHYVYIFSLTELTNNGGKLTIEIYRFQSRGKTGDPVSEYINNLDFQFGSPVHIEASTDGFSVDLALSISAR